ncbi:MAG: isoleucine--tRNA ligase [Oscillospiraceae bacterium]|nr:isoleucine--tRNA ligase [Oscillospiraceae bacterium]
MDYNKTLNLPGTAFPMRASLPQREPEMLERWYTEDLYARVLEKNHGRPIFVLHDGPPYANGGIHLGTALNKVLKDFIVRYRNMSGYCAPYVPGWDTHGLPIELKARKSAGVQAAADLSPVELRALCREFALSYVNEQREQFKRLGVLGEWDDPYLTLKPEFEARQVEIFGKMAVAGHIYKGLKPVYWCPECQTALAEAEIEYSDDKCFSIFVKFRVTDDLGKLTALKADLARTYFVIWTTTTWTLPGNVAICVGPEFDYALIKSGAEYYVMAKELAAGAMKAAGLKDYEILGELTGADLELMQTAHPFLPRQSTVIVGDHVTLESGTGCVHTAPGHGVEDFEVCRKYPQLPIVVPVDSKGVLTKDAGDFAGLSTDDANKAIAKRLEADGNLFALQKINHQYPHCWRCRQPVLFRATEQWFCSIDGFKEQTLSEIAKVNWIPQWGGERIAGMVRDRSDWCISRQRLWGVPIPIFFCEKCGKEHITRQSVAAVAELLGREGADAWWQKPAAEILPEGTVCAACGNGSFTKETDIMDVWFDSGVSHTAVLKEREYLRFPADVYLEGADQYRGWFQSSLLTSVAAFGAAPYKAVVTHGWVVDGEGRKMSKSLGNGIEPQEIIDQYGADILRLWVASSDYHADIRISRDILKQLSEIYRKIRNTARFILGCLADFDPGRDSLPEANWQDIDRFMLNRLNVLIGRVTDAYENYEYHLIFHAVHNFCAVELSNFYLDVLKDRLYVECPKGESRRAAQTVLTCILRGLTLLIAPILSFTADEIWQYIPKLPSDRPQSVMLNDFPKAGKPADVALVAKWEKILAVREDVNKALEPARAAKEIGSGLEAAVTIYAGGDLFELLESFGEKLPGIFIVSACEVKQGHGGAFQGAVVGVDITRANGTKCERCWNYSETVGQNMEHPTICTRCAAVVAQLTVDG